MKEVGGIKKRSGNSAPSGSMMGHCYVLDDALTEAEQRVRAGEPCVIIARVRPPYRLPSLSSVYEAPRYVCFTEWIYQMFATVAWVDYVARVPPLTTGETAHGNTQGEASEKSGQNSGTGSRHRTGRNSGK